ncbi:hypothetical protein [Prochlorococcus sp. MIT 1223]|nr:hypothetical protein [Prochlorococcus sp. MIT 1223]
MVISTNLEIESLGNETKETLGFKTEEEMELALKPLMEKSNVSLENVYAI